MKTDLQMAIWLALLVFTSCANDDEVSLVNHEKFYMNLSWGDSEIVITDQEYQLTTAGSTNVCGVNLVNEQFSDEQYVYGIKELGMEDLDENNFATAIHLYVSKKIYTDELDQEDESSYIKAVLNAETFGFPINTEGYYALLDYENNEHIVDRDSPAEAYLYIDTQEGFYRSTSIVPNERDNRSFFRIDAVEEGNSSVNDYQYIIEGSFRVNLFKGHYGTESEMVAGEFRWPVRAVRTSALLNLCN